MFGPSNQFPLRGKGGAEGTKGVCKRTVSLGAKRRRDTVRRQSERSEVVHFPRPKAGLHVFSSEARLYGFLNDSGIS